MALQNRVTPYGEIVAVPGRGLMMGNRGILHDDARRIIRTFQVKRWIACVLEFRGRRREVMTPHRYTELFFLDEAAAFSAGHRPCAECRRADYNLFIGLWGSWSGAPATADAMDARLQADRIERKRKKTYRDELAKLPDGAYVALDGQAWLVWDSYLLAWSDSRYTRGRPRSRGQVEVLTPRCAVAILAAGYHPMVHPSAGEVALH
ncbi:MAG: hypothetical protein JO190_07045 [Candidatus Eremiobacteraeota bacterium]|nr:hypothetical protein [Candidatus Eremiobacteraeota bacterium]MBV8497737.1 hypothetical protein [Candidatus Eremiobacteraeota bacterium]